MTIWDFQDRLSTTLQGWAASSIGTGLMMTAADEDTVRGMGEQFAGWGAINMAIATFGKRSAAGRREEPNALAPDTLAKEQRNLQRILWVNTGLDVFYVLGGLRLVQTKGREDARWRGRGWGIVVQGGFLFFFDLFQALAVGRLPAASAETERGPQTDRSHRSP